MNAIASLVPSPLAIARTRALGRIVKRGLAARWSSLAARISDLIFATFSLVGIALTIHVILSTWVPILRDLFFLY